MTRPRTPAETPILHAVRHALTSRPDVLLARNNVGVDTARGVRYGLGTGSTDLVGVVTVCTIGVALYVEVKSPTGRLTQEQLQFKAAVTQRGAIHITARSAADALAQLDDAVARTCVRMRNGVDPAAAVAAVVAASKIPP